MSLPAPDKNKFTYGDYLTWPEEERWELIDGQPYDMTPAPSTFHQSISMEFSIQIGRFLADRGCRIFAAPFEVRLPEADEADEEIITVVQPDLAVICNPDRLDKRGCRGAPDWIIEIISPSTAARDQISKVALYERHGIKEYWLVHPEDKLVTIRRLNEAGKYGIPSIHEAKGSLPVGIMPELSIDLDLVFRSIV
jgi:Uma2 family endonuclease